MRPSLRGKGWKSPENLSVLVEGAAFRLALALGKEGLWSLCTPTLNGGGSHFSKSRSGAPSDYCSIDPRNFLFALEISFYDFSFLCGAGLGFRLGLDIMRFDDGHNQSGKAFVDFSAPRGVAHLDADPFSANQARLAERLEMLREG
jgi:hypothetical protein